MDVESQKEIGKERVKYCVDGENAGACFAFRYITKQLLDAV